MGITSLLWYGPKVMAQVEAKVAKNMDRAAIYMVNDVVKHFGNPPMEPDKAGGFKKNSSKKWKRGHPSAPGDPPNVQTGDLWRSMTWMSPAPLVRLVGSSLRYAAALEYGAPSRNLQARPYLRPALARCKAAMFKIIASGK
jgi:phage gpG-like protein